MTHLIRVRNDLQVLGCITSNNSLELQFWLPVTQNDELEAAGSQPRATPGARAPRDMPAACLPSSGTGPKRSRSHSKTAHH